MEIVNITMKQNRSLFNLSHIKHALEILIGTLGVAPHSTMVCIFFSKQTQEEKKERKKRSLTRDTMRSLTSIQKPDTSI